MRCRIKIECKGEGDMKKKGKVIVALIMLLVVLAGCGSKMSGTYASEDGQYSIEFSSDSECTWYQDGSFFNGTYKKTDNGYQLEMIGEGLYSNTVFTVEMDGEDLIISGGTVDQMRFVKK